MNFLIKLSSFIGKYMIIFVLFFSIISLFLPQSMLWIQTSWINYLLMIVMFGMGLTLKLDDFKIIIKRPKDIIIGCLAQYTIMPLLAFGLAKLFHLDLALTIGVILVGTCPGGTASNVITYLSDGDVALSIGMTSINTLLAPILTPLITYLFLKTSINVDISSMILSILQVVIIPIGLGFMLSLIIKNKKDNVTSILPMVSVIAICMIIASVVSHNSEKILSTGVIIFVVVILHNILGYICGFLLGVLLKLNIKKKKALSIEIGMQNSGLATNLALNSFKDLNMATVPGAIFSVWHNISGALLSTIFKRIKPKNEKNNKPIYKIDENFLF